MREIKFRAWSKSVKRMLLWDELWGNHPICDFDASGLEWMQYTGLKDKNGREIYEGDICRVTEEYHKDKPWVAEVGFVGSGFCFVNRKCCSHCAKLEGCICQLDELIADIEVIGNIYENKELLK